MAKNRHQKVPKSDFQSQFSTSQILWIFLKKKFLLKNINLGATFLFLSILCSIKIERLLFLIFLKKLAFFDSYFWPFNKTHEKIIAIYVISAIMASIWNVFIKFRWHDEKFTVGPDGLNQSKFHHDPPQLVWFLFWFGFHHHRSQGMLNNFPTSTMYNSLKKV